MDKRVFKKTGEELQSYLAFKHRGFMKPTKKGKGSKYNRQEEKKISFDEQEQIQDIDE